MFFYLSGNVFVFSRKHKFCSTKNLISPEKNANKKNWKIFGFCLKFLGNQKFKMLQKILDKTFGSFNQKQIRAAEKLLPAIRAAHKNFSKLSESDLRKKFASFRKILEKNPENTDPHLPEIFGAICAACDHLCGKTFEIRSKKEIWNMRPYDCQLIGGIVLHRGQIAEMKTGEGKTLVCTLPVILNALAGKGVHVVTVNDYLAERDAEWMGPLYEFCGLSIGTIVHGRSNAERKDAYSADVTYGTNNEFGFDYLRDNMAQNPQNIVQRDLHFAIVDEVDSILIDEARTPLIISAPAEESTEKYAQHAQIASELVENEDFNLDLKLKHVSLSENGIAKVEKILNVKNIYTESGFDEVHHIENALKAKVVFQKDKDYVVRDNQVIIVDEFTGRLMPGRRFSDGLHQALEAKENVEIQRESKTLATITFQNYFRLYSKLSGMSGSAETEAEEFAKIYKLETIVIPTNVAVARSDLSDKIFKNQSGKFSALAETVSEMHQRGQPVLIGTVNIDSSEILSDFLTSKRIPHEILNAKQHEREAEIVARAGRAGAVTIATNMAGRGTDIKLDEDARTSGGLAVLGTQRHESRRIDNQLRGRSGRQGDPGFSQFYISMDDELMRRFGGEKMARIMHQLKIPDDEPIENRMISRSVESAQKKIEGFHFDSRKHVVQYDDVMNVHREKMYRFRREILFDPDFSAIAESLFGESAEQIARMHAPTPEKSLEWDRGEISEILSTMHGESDAKKIQKSLEKIEQQEDLIAFLKKFFQTHWSEKIQKFDPKMVAEVARQILLRSIDQLWLEHLDEMTHLRDRVALSGYAQKDPVMEYRREAFSMFSRLLFHVRISAISNLFRFQFAENFKLEFAEYSDAKTNETEIETTPFASPAAENASANLHSGRSVAAEKLGEKYAEIGRNDPCPCGSGQKFKKCHGKNV